MNPDRADLEQSFRLLSDEELLRRGASGGLTELAQAVALAEIAARGLSLPAQLEAEPEPPEEYHGDMRIVARQLTPTEAQIIRSCLRAGGIPADAGDTNLVQAYSLIAPALGGACIRVPEAYVAAAKEAIAAFWRGDFELKEDFDPGHPS